MKFTNGLSGYLSLDLSSYKRLSVKHPPDSPTFHLIEIREFYKNRNKKSDEGLYLLESEYESLVGILPYGKYKVQPFEFKNGPRTLKTSPNQNNGGINVLQKIEKKSFDEEKEVHLYSEQNRKLHLSKRDIDIIINNYGCIENFVEGYYNPQYPSSDEEKEEEEEVNEGESSSEQMTE